MKDKGGVWASATVSFLAWMDSTHACVHEHTHIHARTDTPTPNTHKLSVIQGFFISAAAAVAHSLSLWLCCYWAMAANQGRAAFTAAIVIQMGFEGDGGGGCGGGNGDGGGQAVSLCVWGYLMLRLLKYFICCNHPSLGRHQISLKRNLRLNFIFLSRFSLMP